MRKPIISACSLLALCLLHVEPLRAHTTAGVVGDGTPASCTDMALATAILGGGNITFNCGGPYTLMLSSPKTIGANTHIDGGGQITLTTAVDNPAPVATPTWFAVRGRATFTVENIALVGLRSRGYDGGAIVNEGTLVVNNVTFRGNSAAAPFMGGAIFTVGPAFITNSTFEQNYAGSGGAIAATLSGGRVTIDHSTFMSNTIGSKGIGDDAGGAVWIGARAHADIRGSVFVGNAANAGGALFVDVGGSASLASSPSDGRPVRLENNTAEFAGGGLWNAGSVEISGAAITANRTMTSSATSGIGGGVVNWNGTLSMTGTTVAGNISRFGGGLFSGEVRFEGVTQAQAQDVAEVAGTHAATAPNAHTTIRSSTFSNNQAVREGGGIDVRGATISVTLDMAQSALVGNTAQFGGGLALDNARVTVEASAIVSNTASKAGGGVLAGFGGNAILELNNVTLSGNTIISSSMQGGGLYNAGFTALTHVTVKNNSNGIYSHAGKVALRNSVLENPGFLNCDGSGLVPASLGANVVTDDSCGSELPKNAEAALLGPLQRNASGQFFHGLLTGSPLIGAGAADCSQFDQRGALRRRPCDIGAIEFNALFPRSLLPVVTR